MALGVYEHIIEASATAIVFFAFKKIIRKNAWIAFGSDTLFLNFKDGSYIFI